MSGSPGASARWNGAATYSARRRASARKTSEHARQSVARARSAGPSPTSTSPSRARCSGRAPIRGPSREILTPTYCKAVPRLAFVGQRVYFGYTSLQAEADGVAPSFVDYRHGADPEPMLAELRALAPDVVFVWRPEIIPAGAFADLDAVTVGYLTEPLPRPGNGAPHADLLQRLEYLELADGANFDRIVSFDPLV